MDHSFYIDSTVDRSTYVNESQCIASSASIQPGVDVNDSMSSPKNQQPMILWASMLRINWHMENHHNKQQKGKFNKAWYSINVKFCSMVCVFIHDDRTKENKQTNKAQTIVTIKHLIYWITVWLNAWIAMWMWRYHHM